MFLSIEPSNALLSILTLASTSASILSITPPNPNPHSGEKKSANAASAARPADTIAGTTSPFFLRFTKTWIATLGLIHAIITLYYPSDPPANICPNPANLFPQLFIWSWVTLVLNTSIIVAAVIRRQCFVQLGKSFTFQLAAPKELVTTGIYKYIQHPSYTTLFTIMFSYTLLVGSRGGLLGCWVNMSWTLYWGPAAFYWALVIWHFRTRVGEEEKMLKETFGKKWEVWHQKTARFIPGLI